MPEPYTKKTKGDKNMNRTWFVGEPENFRTKPENNGFMSPKEFENYEFIMANKYYKKLMMSANWKMVKISDVPPGTNVFVCVDTDKKLVRNISEREYYIMKAEPVNESTYELLEKEHKRSMETIFGDQPPAVIRDYLKSYKPAKTAAPAKKEEDYGIEM